MIIFKKKKVLALLLLLVLFSYGCAARYYLDAPVSDPIMFADDNQNSDLSRVEDGGLSGSAGECPT
ncbi:MAG TPA: hypothetical protein VGD14_01280 [bacterium]